ncbi:MAG: DUF3365 domain-containing protein [Planctomycetales bacterium]|nr:DUF3365 domain-containing protein [Planctomycetales bacterium]
MRKRLLLSNAAVGFFATHLLCTAGCGGSAPPSAEGISPQKFADAVHAVMMADRTVYATHVVTRLKDQEAPVSPSEYWKDEEHKIPLPAQMFRMGAELVSANESAGFSYALKSKWPLNKQNRAKTELEIKGIDALIETPEKPYYETEEIAGKKYFTAFYADRAVAKACWGCHNAHTNKEADYPEFKENDVMGAVIVRVPLD